ncbi:MAG: O-antigen ligase family protein [Pseudomonadales bacterium]
MSQFRGRHSGPVLLLGLMAYLLMLAVALLWLHLSPGILLGLTIGVIALVVMALNPLLALHAFIMLLSVENIVATEEGVTGMKLLGPLILGGWLLSVATQKRFLVRSSGLLIAIGLFLIWGAVTAIFAYDPDIAIGKMLTYVQLAVAAAMFSAVVGDPGRLKGIYWSIVLWTLCSTLVAIFGYYSGSSAVAVGLTGNRNLLALYINIAIVCAFVLFQTTRHAFARLILIVVIPIFFLGLALTFSRTGLIVMSIGLALVWYRIARDRGFFIMAISAATLCALVMLLPEAFFQRVETIVPAIQRQEGTFGSRVQLWKMGLRMIEDRPITGVGPGNFIAASPRYARGGMIKNRLVAHNAFIAVAAEMGLVGLAVFVAILIFALRNAMRAASAGRVRGSKELQYYPVAIEAALIIIIVSGLTGDVQGLKVLWLFLGLSWALDAMIGKSQVIAVDEDRLSRTAA